MYSFPHTFLIFFSFPPSSRFARKEIINKNFEFVFGNINHVGVSYSDYVLMLLPMHWCTVDNMQKPTLFLVFSRLIHVILT